MSITYEYQATVDLMYEDGTIDEGLFYTFQSDDQLDEDDVIEIIMIEHRADQGRLVDYDEIELVDAD